jgi:hypothetical protein
MRWNSAHVGNVRQAPLEDQPAVNDEMKVPDTSADSAPEEGPDVEEPSAEPKAEPKAEAASTSSKTTTAAKA